MLRHGLVVTLLAGTGCSVPNPFFDVVSEGPPSGTDALTTTQDVTSEPTTSASSESTTDAPGTSTSASTGPHTTTEATTSEPESVCGDGVHNGTEECDDGNQVDTDACLSSCVTAKCGDEIVWKGHENCDDGDGDACPADCKSATCGNGMVDPGSGEDCDDGNLENTDGCLVGCLPATCGDGFLHAGVEECDDGNTSDTDACTSACLPAKCGDGFVEAGVEECDDGNPSEDDGCNSECKEGFCGDGVVQPGEACDDGPNTEFCINECTEIVFCNNNKLDVNEECDPSMPPFMNLPGLCDPTECTINGCFRVHNTVAKELVFMGNTWLDECAAKPGQNVIVALLTEANEVAYLAKGTKIGVWNKSNLTAGIAGPTVEYDVYKHSRKITMNHLVPNDGLQDVLMVTSQVAAQPGAPVCKTSLGDGYGIAMWANNLPFQLPKMLVMGFDGGSSKVARPIAGFGPGEEISFNPPGMNMPMCGDGVKAFFGTFILSVL